jgi:CHAT domain-containing protein
VTTELADKLIRAESVEKFLGDAERAGWEMVSSLKSEMDRIVGRDLNLAGVLADRVERVAEALGDSLSLAFASAARARVLHHTGRHLEADRLYQGAIDTLNGAKLKAEAAVIQKQRVDALKHLGRYDEALRVANAARRVLSRKDPIELAQLETNVGNIYYQLDRYNKALEHYDRAREIFSTAGEDSMRAFVDFSRSNIFTEKDRPEEALALLESAASAWERSGSTLLAAQARFHIAYLQFLRGNYNLALAGYGEAREQLDRLGSRQLVAFCCLDMSETLLALNAFDEAVESAATARTDFESLGMQYEAAKATMIHALALGAQRQFDEAQAGLLRARDAFTASGNSTFAALADSYLAQLAIARGEPEEAAARASSSLRVFARQRINTRSAHIKLLQARAAYQMGERAKAARMARAALGLIEGLFAPGIAYQCHHLLGRIERDRKRAAAARDSFRLAVESVEKMRGGIVADEFKATFLRDKIEAYEDAIASCLDAGTPEMVEEAFRLVESAKSRSLADLLARYVRGREETRGNENGTRSETRARLARLIEELNWYSSQAGMEEDKGTQRSAEVACGYRQAVARCERQIARMFRRLEHENTGFAEIQRMRPATVEDLSQTLERGEVAVEYFTTAGHVSAFIATRDRVKVARAIASRADVERALGALRFQIEKFNYGAEYVEAHFSQLRRSMGEHLDELYDLIFAPVESMLESDRLIVIPHGALHYVPFHALRDRDHHLIERYEISYAPSAAVLRLCRARSAESRARRAVSDSESEIASGSMVALGVLDGGTPNIEDEIETLGSLFPDAVKLTGGDATRENLLKLAPRARFLHLASHGYFRRDNPMFSFLKLADSNLHFYGLLDLKLDAEMVTLSACHTGVNMIFPGDELHGLMRGFLYAGAPSLVASLWAVSDNSTAEFMREMYRRIKAGAPKRTALREAQLAIKDSYGHPYYWAPFVLMGDPV